MNVKGTSSQTYALIPSIPRLSPLGSSVPMLPAVPVRFESGVTIERFAVLDTGGSTSLMPRSLASTLGLPIQAITPLATVFGKLETSVVTSDVTICDEGFDSWIVLSAVPFAIIDDEEDLGGKTWLTLGAGALSNLSISIDFKEDTLTVSAPMSLTRPTVASRAHRRLSDARRLFELGAYRDAVAFASAAVEDAARKKLPRLGDPLPIASTLQRAGVSRRMAQDFLQMRNRAVHGKLDAISESDASRSLSLADSVLRRLRAS